MPRCDPAVHGRERDSDGGQADAVLVKSRSGQVFTLVAGCDSRQIMPLGPVLVDAGIQPVDPAGGQVDFQRVQSPGGWSRSQIAVGSDALPCPQKLPDLGQRQTGASVLTNRTPRGQAFFQGNSAAAPRRRKLHNVVCNARALAPLNP